MTYDRHYLHNAYNATSTNNDIGELESYKEWLERQLLSRIKEMNQYPKLRPMSELGNFKNLYGDFLVFHPDIQVREYEEFELEDRIFILNPKSYKIIIKFNEDWVCEDNEEFIFLGFIEKPNPNDIKL